MNEKEIEARRQLINLETFSTPLQFLAATESIKASGDSCLSDLVEGSISMLALRGVGTPSPLILEYETRYARLFSSPATQRKRLIIAFTGAAMRLMMPLPVFMQEMPENIDILLLYDPKKSHYRCGIWDGNSTIWDLPRIFTRILASYADVIAFGASSGGLPSLRFARHAGLRRGISVGGRPIDDTMRILRRERVPIAYDGLCSCAEAASTEDIFLYAAENSLDAHAAERASISRNSCRIALAGRSNHAALWEIWRMGFLRDFLENAFSASALSLAEAVNAWNLADLHSESPAQSMNGRG